MPGQVVEQPELGRGGRDQLAAHAQLHGAGVDLDLLELHHRRRGGALEAPQHGLDPGHQLARGEGLGDVVVGTEFEAVDAIVLGGARGEKDDRHHAHAGILAQPPAEIQPVAARHHDVQEKESRRLALRIAEDGADRRV